MLLKSIENLHHDFEKLPHNGKALAMSSTPLRKISVNLFLYIIKIAEKHFGSFQNCIFFVLKPMTGLVISFLNVLISF